MPQELKVIADFYDLMLWLICHTEKFPRHHRYSLGVAIEDRLQAILSLLLRAKYSKDKAVYLNDANIELEVLRFQMRLAKDLINAAQTSPWFKTLREAVEQLLAWEKEGYTLFTLSSDEAGDLDEEGAAQENPIRPVDFGG